MGEAGEEATAVWDEQSGPRGHTDMGSDIDA